MKKITVTAIAVYAVFALANCATTKAGKTVTLDQAIQEAAKNIENTVQAGQKIAVLNFTSPTEQFSAYVIDELSIQLANGRKVVVVDRRELDLIRQEEQFQLSGEVSDESALSIGKKLGAQYIVSGSLNAMGNAYRFRVRVLNVENAVVEAGSTADLSIGETKVAFMLSDTRPAPVTVQPAPATPTPTAPPQTPVPNNMVRINGGTFQRENNTVTISSFYMGKYEVTVGEFRQFVNATGYKTEVEKSEGGRVQVRTGRGFETKPDANWKNPYFGQGDMQPVVLISWNDAVQYCNWLSQTQGLTPAYTINETFVNWNRNANGYRLPTEAEWEYAARGGNGSPGNYDYAGSNNADEVAWHSGNSVGSTQIVGTKKHNGLGLYDMSGNVYEWCWDWYGNYSSSSQIDPVGASFGNTRVYRGGGWSYDKIQSRSSKRDIYNEPEIRGTYNVANYIGFRLVRNAQ